MSASRHPAPALLDAFVAGTPAGAELAAHLARCAACRRTVAARDASALFGLLADLPARPVPAWPGIEAVLAATGDTRPHVARAPSPWRTALASAAMLAAAALALVFAVRPPAVSRAEQARPLARVNVAVATASAATQAVVGQVDSPTAQIVTLVPPGGDGPSVTLILDEGFDL